VAGKGNSIRLSSSSQLADGLRVGSSRRWCAGTKQEWHYIDRPPDLEGEEVGGTGSIPTIQCGSVSRPKHGNSIEWLAASTLAISSPGHFALGLEPPQR